MMKITIIIKMRKRYENIIISRELSLMDEFLSKLLIVKVFLFNPFLLYFQPQEYSKGGDWGTFASRVLV